MNISILIRLSCFTTLVILTLMCSSVCKGQAINWFPDTATAAKAAAEQDKIIFLHFGSAKCRPCEELNTYVFSDPTVQRAFAADLIAVKVDVETQMDLVEEFGVRSTPTDVAIAPDGQILSSRKSPAVAASYLKMISDIKMTRSKLQDPDAHIENAAYQIQQAARKSAGIQAQTASFTPSGSFTPSFPAQSPVQPEASSIEVKQKSQVIKNPFVQSAAGSGTKFAGAPTNVAMKQEQVAPKPYNASAPMKMPAPLQMPGQLSLPGQLSMPDQLSLPAPLEMAKDGLSVLGGPDQGATNGVDAGAAVVEGQLTAGNKFGSAKPVPPRNLALKRLEQSDVAARLVRDQAEQKHASFKSDPKLVMEDRFYGNRTARQPASEIAGNYQAKINLPQEKADTAVGFVPPEPPSFGSETAGEVMGREVDPLGPKATLASSSVSALKKSPEASGVVQDGLDQASATPAKPSYALHGKCPVTLLTRSKWVDGEEEIGCVHRNRIYIFASDENLQTFQSDPDAYSPILAGYDPVIFEETGRLVDGLEEYGVFMGKTPKQRIVLFASPETRARFQLEPRKYLQTVRQAMDKSSSSAMR